MPLFSPDFHRRVARVALLILLAAVAGLGAVYCHCFDKPDYAPVQPVDFSHKVHVGQLGMDCSACHTGIHLSPRAGLPDTQTCLDCHRLVKRDSPAIEPLLQAADRQYAGYTGVPIRWIKVNRLPDFVQFNHQAHVARGVGCTDCHGDVAGMERLSIEQNRGMRWCMDCHRNPAPRLRPLEEITNQAYRAEQYLERHDIRNAEGTRLTGQAELGQWLSAKWLINPKTDCTACHQ